MAMTIIGDEGVPDVYASKLFDALKLKEEDFTVIYIDRKTANGWRQEMQGVHEALKYAPLGKPVILLGFRTLLSYSEHPKWHGLLGYSNVHFLRMPMTLADADTAYHAAKNLERIADPMAIALLNVDLYQSEMSLLKHDLSHAQRVGGSKFEDWIQRAKKVLTAAKTNDELVFDILNWCKPDSSASQFVGQQFPDVCVDVEGTLFTSQGELNRDVLTVVEAAGMIRPVTVWTGGNLETARKWLKDAKLCYKLVAKQAMQGAHVDFIIDDLPQEEFEQEYGITCRQYVKV